MHDHHPHHPHDHDHDHHGSELSPMEARLRALESILVEKGYVEPAALDTIIDTYETKIGPRNGAKVVARAWSDAAYAQRLREDATAALAELPTPEADIDNMNKTIQDQEETINTLEVVSQSRLFTGLIQGAVIGLVTGGAVAWVVSRRIRVLEVDENE